MIVKVKMFACKCDNCKEQYVDDYSGFTAMTDKFGIKVLVGEDSEWHTENNELHYCPKCYKGHDEEDNLLIDYDRKKY